MICVQITYYVVNLHVLELDHYYLYFIIVMHLKQEYIRESMQHTVVVKASLSGFDVTAVAVVGSEYD